MIQIRVFGSYADAEQAVIEAGGVYVIDSGADSFAPTITYRLPDGQLVEVMWNNDRGYIRRGR